MLRARVGQAYGQLAGWLLATVVHGTVVAIWAPRAARSSWLWRQLCDGGTLLGAALLASGIAALASRSPRWLQAAASILAAATWGWLQAEDVTGLVSPLPGPVEVYAAMLAALLMVGVLWTPMLAAWAAQGRPWVSAVVSTLAMTVVAGHGFVLVTGYESLHLLALVSGAAAAGGAISELPSPALPRRVIWPAQAVMAVLGAVALTVTPPSAVASDALRWPGSAFTPYLSQLRDSACARPEPPERAWPGPSPQPRPPSPPLLGNDAIVLLFTVDALRADRIDDDKNAAKLPTFARLRRQSVVFTEARSTAPATAPAIGSLMTGRYYSQLYWSNQRIAPRNKLKLTLHEDDTQGFPAILGAAGVRTVHLATDDGPTTATGLARGFAEERMLERSAAEYPKALAEVLDAHAGGPLFVYGHFIEPHYPYDAKGDSPLSKYLGEVARVDGALNKILRLLKERGLTDRTAIMVTADHGEAFGEHDTKYHGVTVYEELLHVPMMLMVPGLEARSVDAPVSLIDVGATMLDLFGQPTPSTWLGQSLLPAARGDASGLQRPVAADSGRRVQAMYFADGTKVIQDLRHGTLQLFDLRRDPLELQDLAGSDPVLACRHARELRTFFDAHQLRRPGYTIPYRP